MTSKLTSSRWADYWHLAPHLWSVFVQSLSPSPLIGHLLDLRRLLHLMGLTCSSSRPHYQPTWGPSGAKLWCQPIMNPCGVYMLVGSAVNCSTTRCVTILYICCLIFSIYTVDYNLDSPHLYSQLMIYFKRSGKRCNKSPGSTTTRNILGPLLMPRLRSYWYFYWTFWPNLN